MKNWQGSIRGFVICIVIIFLGCGGGAQNTYDTPDINNSFFPILFEDEIGNLLKPCWEYRIDGCELFDPNANIILKVTIDPNTLERKSYFSGKLSDFYVGSFSLFVKEKLKSFDKKIFIENQNMIMVMDAYIANTNELIKKYFESIIDFDPSLELFLDRNNLDNFPIGYIYDEQEMINVTVNESEIEEYPNNPVLNTYNQITLNKEVTPNWKIINKHNAITILGKEYLNVVVIEYNHSDDEKEKVTYWVSKGVGIVKSIGQYHFFGAPLIVELEKTNFNLKEKEEKFFH